MVGWATNRKLGICQPKNDIGEKNELKRSKTVF